MVSMIRAMAEEEPVVNPCCSVWKFQYTKVTAKRNALRQAVDLLEAHIDKIGAEKLTISKALEEERARVKAEKEAKTKESAVRVELENEVLRLKSEITSLQETAYSKGLDQELLQTQITEGEAEINRLKELLEKEKKRGDAEKKKAEKKAAEELKLLKAELQKRCAEEERKKLLNESWGRPILKSQIGSMKLSSGRRRCRKIRNCRRRNPSLLEK
ncbi:hypothetical protein MKW94_020476 [Papaver nudicaule]|uniref:Uncharacterized protein n=1 Tax=Papaver nudicaule TaxID=74823 RepID=A0AA41SHA5_PAPNU|nr:hypothetical protein [Papaver nudicaule]